MSDTVLFSVLAVFVTVVVILVCVVCVVHTKERRMQIDKAAENQTTK